MKNLSNSVIGILLLFVVSNKLWCQEEKKEVVKKPFITLKYFNVQNQMQYVIVSCQLKVEKKLEPIANLGVKIYLEDENDEKNLIGKVITNETGKAKSFIPVTFKDIWMHSSHHKLIAVTDSISGLGVRQAETEIAIARISLDTVADSDTRKVQVHLEELKDSIWMPVKEAEVKLGIKRLGSQLPMGESETVTTDTAGIAIAEFNKDSLPGDSHGNLILIAKVEDNETYGNLVFEKSVAWGKPFNYVSSFDKRTLWATGPKVPLWLLSIAVIIIFSVWGTLIYLVRRLLKIRKLGID